MFPASVRKAFQFPERCDGHTFRQCQREPHSRQCEDLSAGERKSTWESGLGIFRVFEWLKERVMVGSWQCVDEVCRGEDDVIKREWEREMYRDGAREPSPIFTYRDGVLLSG